MANVLSAIAIVMSALIFAVPAQAAWAIAVDEAGDGVLEYAKHTIGEAKTRARNECGKRFGDCEVVASGAGGCVAVASDGRKWDVAKASRKADAYALAIEGCSAAGGTNCRVVQDHCGS